MNKNLLEVDQNPNSDVAVESQDKKSSQRKSRIVSRFLSPALQFWLKSQLEQIGQLKVKIEGGDRQILTGKIPEVSVTASDVIFRGLHLTKVELLATGIRINIGQIIKGKPLQILESFPIFCQIELLESDFNASLQSPLLAKAIIDFLTPLLPQNFLENLDKPIEMYDHKAEISIGKINLFTNFISKTNDNNSLTLDTEMKLSRTDELLLENLNLEVSQKPNYQFSDNIKVNLGSDVELEELILEYGQLSCRGKLIVNP
ncbi:MAG: DUF2993 domain-containing protein [Trichodesmium sp.]